MRHLAIIVGLLLGAGACGGSKAEDALKEFEGFRDKMCACKDKECTEKVESDWREWRKGLKDKIKKEDMTPELNARGKKIDDEMDTCRDKIRAEAKGAEKPAATP